MTVNDKKDIEKALATLKVQQSKKSILKKNDRYAKYYKKNESHKNVSFMDDS
eukprot:CAMPEP_0176369102 /NCGR_PEP_ID=MMETSP0126-20121128/23058_1 /TAXON_ID=141414 ORGANISM="Strombidinopsis acuminatum, Strain SPMC142" /NCGR_SAMPLE_ID=MMETSP0126 /ASSEMBLY_ACC=CAM_ASM_000229 /LENGTH=51 /DNA_ID=CAMNT_0017727615 /DNA_START=163 /DNA_END=318 /DNA_ORIENTATION=+